MTREETGNFVFVASSLTTKENCGLLPQDNPRFALPFWPQTKYERTKVSVVFNSRVEGMKISEERLEEIKKLSTEPDVYERLAAALGEMFVSDPKICEAFTGIFAPFPWIPLAKAVFLTLRNVQMLLSFRIDYLLQPRVFTRMKTSKKASCSSCLVVPRKTLDRQEGVTSGNFECSQILRLQLW